jgi:DNA-binding transcriptional MerR regulator
VSVRTLHYYDELGLLVPARRTPTGYRLYGDADLLRLQQIVIGRELGLSLEQIRRSLDDPGFDLKQALRKQRAELEARAQRAAQMIRAVDQALAALEANSGGDSMRPQNWFEGFEPSKYEEEAKQRWGDTEAYRISAERAQRYTPEDWRRIRDEQSAIYEDLAAAMRAGRAAHDPVSMDIAERARLCIERWFYPCSHAMHCGLADLYENDPRFAANIDKYGDGLTAFLSAAIRSNAERHA